WPPRSGARASPGRRRACWPPWPSPSWSRSAFFAEGGGSALPGEAATSEQLHEPGISSIRIPPGVHGQIDEVNVPLGVCLVQPLEHRVSIAEAGMNKRDRIW